MDYGQACRQTFIYRITEGFPVIQKLTAGGQQTGHFDDLAT
jgi:hypothetical protein